MTEKHEDQPQIQLPLEEEYIDKLENKDKKEEEDRRGVEIIELLKSD